MAPGPRALRIGKSRGYEGFTDENPDEDGVPAETNGDRHANGAVVRTSTSAERPSELRGLQSDEGAAQAPAMGASCFMALLTLNAAIGGFLFGYDTGVVSGAMLQIKTKEDGIGDLTPEEQEVLVSSTVAAAVVGAITSGALQSRLWIGRRSAILIGTGLFVAGALQMAAALDFLSLTFGRIVVGLGVGMASHAVPLYISECSPASQRGRLSAVYAIFIVLGQVVASLVCCALARAAVPQGWRWMLGLGAAPAVVMGLGFCVLPESPRFLVLQGRGDNASMRQAEAVLMRLRGAKDKGAVAQELQQALDSLDKGPRVSVWEVMKRPGVRRAMALGCSMQLLQQLCGINTLMYYAATILQMSEMSGSKGCSLPNGNSDEIRDICLTASLALAQLVGSMVGTLLVDRCGRRPLTLTSLVGVSSSLFVLGAAFHPGGLEARSAPVWAMVAYLLFFGVGMGPMPWTVNAEIYPLEARSFCSGLASATNWISNFLVAATFLDLSVALSTDRACPEAHPDGAFWLYGAIGVVGFFGLAWFMPETRGLELEEITQLFENAARGPSGGQPKARDVVGHGRQRAPEVHEIMPDE